MNEADVCKPNSREQLFAQITRSLLYIRIFLVVNLVLLPILVAKSFG